MAHAADARYSADCGWEAESDRSGAAGARFTPRSFGTVDHRRKRRPVVPRRQGTAVAADVDAAARGKLREGQPAVSVSAWGPSVVCRGWDETDRPDACSHHEIERRPHLSTDFHG